MGIALGLLDLAALAWFGSPSILGALLTVGYFAGWDQAPFHFLDGVRAPRYTVLSPAGARLRPAAENAPPAASEWPHASVLLLTLYCLFQFLNPEAPLLRSLAGFRSWLLYMWLLFAGYEMLHSSRQIRQMYG